METTYQHSESNAEWNYWLVMENMTLFWSNNMKILFYNSYVLSRIDYCLSIWGGAHKYILQKLFKLQKKSCQNNFKG